ncbi:MAG TPA: hypothetical protein VGA13_11260 [Acidimicrobiales bacterium]|jgi:hypothetical protein
MTEPHTTGSHGIADQAREIWDLVVAYARQETVAPIRGLGRYVGYGLGGSLLVAIGLALGVLAGLRALQTETGTTFDAELSWAPYVIVAGAAMVVMALLLFIASRRPSRRSDQ